MEINIVFARSANHHGCIIEFTRLSLVFLVSGSYKIGFLRDFS